ncbi:MAG: tetratricopeptide (TPR) repeat protein [Chlamydiales bacterium]|jgi:tetratricopeptide (TPR) repeat protein
MENIDWCEILGWDIAQLEDLRYLGYAYIKQGKYETAQSFFEALVAVNPKSSYDVQTLGAVYLQMGDSAKALFYLDQALKLDDLHGPTLINRCKALLILGQLREGIQLAKKLKKHKEKDIADVASALVLAYS